MGSCPGCSPVIRLPTNVPQKAMEDGPSAWTLASPMGDLNEAPSFDLIQSWLPQPSNK